jgi:asparagine synthase (glutamine-hydrolysing)
MTVAAGAARDVARSGPEATIPPMVCVLSFAHDGREEQDRVTRQAEHALAVRGGDRAVHQIDGPRMRVLTIGRTPAADGGRTDLTVGCDHREVDLPPAARLHLDGRQVRLSTDAVGLKHLYITRGEGWVAASTSALVLGGLRGTPRLDPLTWGALALMGFAVASRTVLADVQRVPAGCDLILTDGRARIEQRDEAVSEPGGDGASAVRDAVGQLLDAHPDLGLELSGGLDSRVMLAALPRDQRKGRVALTIGSAGDADVVVARQLATRFGLEHHVVEPATGPHDPVEALRAVIASGRAREHASDALGARVLDDVEGQAPVGPRLTGVNGEFVRGFYYPGTPRSGPVTRSRVARLARWRMFANHRTATWLFDQHWLEEQERSLVDLATRTLQGYALPWRPATDEYYLRERIPNWAGPGYSHAATQRPVLAPFLHPAFISWARSTPPSERADSRALAGVLASLEPGLADISLAGGPAPADLLRGGPSAAIDRGRRFAGKLTDKVRQRLRDERRAPRGAAALLPYVAEGLATSDLGTELRGVDFLDPAALERVAAGAVRLDQPTASLLVNLLGTSRFLDDASDRAGHHAPPSRTGASREELRR